jgi:hypothetical protein
MKRMFMGVTVREGDAEVLNISDVFGLGPELATQGRDPGRRDSSA